MDRKNAHAQLLQAAQVEGPAQVPASSPGTLPRACPILVLPRKQCAVDMQQCMPDSWLQSCPSKGCAADHYVSRTLLQLVRLSLSLASKEQLTGNCMRLSLWSQTKGVCCGRPRHLRCWEPITRKWRPVTGPAHGVAGSAPCPSTRSWKKQVRRCEMADYYTF